MVKKVNQFYEYPEIDMTVIKPNLKKNRQRWFCRCGRCFYFVLICPFCR